MEILFICRPGSHNFRQGRHFQQICWLGKPPVCISPGHLYRVFYMFFYMFLCVLKVTFFVYFFFSWISELERSAVSSVLQCLIISLQLRFNNYVTLKLRFWSTYPPPSRFVTFVHKNPLALSHAQHKHLPSYPIKNKILGFRKDWSRSKEIPFLFHMIFFQLSTNNTKKIICL